MTGTPRLLLRLEGLAVLACAVVAYRALGASWSLFALLFLAPDLALNGRPNPIYPHDTKRAVMP